MIPPMPAENPATTACGTLLTCRPSRITQNAIISTDATIETLAAPPIPWLRTAAAMNGTVTLPVPPISIGFRPSSAITGAVSTDVRIPKIGGSPISAAIESPYGRAIKAAIAPPPQSPRNSFQLYFPVRRIMCGQGRSRPYAFITFRYAALNLFISSCVPMETRT